MIIRGPEKDFNFTPPWADTHYPLDNSDDDIIDVGQSNAVPWCIKPSNDMNGYHKWQLCGDDDKWLGKDTSIGKWATTLGLGVNMKYDKAKKQFETNEGYCMTFDADKDQLAFATPCDISNPNHRWDIFTANELIQGTFEPGLQVTDIPSILEAIKNDPEELSPEARDNWPQIKDS
jgi:hypothetical protein